MKVKKSTVAQVQEVKVFCGGADNAYMTVEAVLVLPMVMAVIALILGGIIFQYNRCLLEQELAILTVWGVTEDSDTEASFEQALSKRIEALYWDKYVLWEMEELSAKKSYDTLHIKGLGVTRAGRALEAVTEYRFRALDQVRFIRGLDRVKETVEKED